MSWRSRVPGVSRWWLVGIAALTMGLGGTYQFLWSTLREPLSVRLATSEPSLGTVFTVYVVFQTLSQFPAGWVRDRFGPRLPMFVGALLLGLGFAGTALLESVPGVVASWAVGGVGVGIVYTVAVNTPVKWFTDRRGLATGLVTMSFGGASFLLIPVVRNRIDADFQTTVLALAGIAAVGCLLAAIILRDPTLRESEGEEGVEPGQRDDVSEADEGPVEDPAATDAATTEGVPSQRQAGVSWRGAIRTWQFWLLYAILIANNLVGLMIIGKTITFATELGLSAGAATLGASLIAIGEAGGVLAGGVASDRLGYRPVAGGAMVLAGLSLGGGVLAGDAGFGLGFAVLIAGGAFFRAPVFAVFPALVGEYYGPKHSSQNYAMLYSAKLWGGLGAGVVASAVVGLAGWSTLFLVGAGLFVLAGIATMLVRPVR
jgi:OFA family oxalate/formate antiporter-like MFS transporter